MNRKYKRLITYCVLAMASYNTGAYHHTDVPRFNDKVQEIQIKDEQEIDPYRPTIQRYKDTVNTSDRLEKLPNWYRIRYTG